MSREGMLGLCKRDHTLLILCFKKKKEKKIIYIYVVTDDVAKIPGLAADGAIMWRHTYILRSMSVCAYIW